MVKVYKSNETDFESNGLAVLNNCKSCFITQELNGAYNLELEHPVDERGKYKFLEGFNIVKADGQLFRIDTPESVQGSVFSKKVYAPHIFYDNNYGFIENIVITDNVIGNALNSILQGSKFNALSSDVAKINTATFTKINPTQAIFNILDLWGGELHRNNFSVAIKSRIGSNKSVLISYAKNITGFNQKLDYTSIATRILITGKDGITIESINNSSKYLDSPLINTYPFPIIREKSFPAITDLEELKAAGLALWGIIDIPSSNYTINFPDLSKTDEYKNFVALQSVEIGDTVIVKHKIFNVDMKLRVIKIKKDVLLNKFVEIELGDFKPNLGKTLNKQLNDVEDAKDALNNTKKDIELITGLTDEDVKKVKDDIAGIDGVISSIDECVVDIAEDIGKLEDDINETSDNKVKASFLDLKSDFMIIKTDIALIATDTKNVNMKNPNFEKINKDISKCEDDISAVNTDIFILKQDISASTVVSSATLFTDIDALETDIDVLITDINKLKENIDNLEEDVTVLTDEEKAGIQSYIGDAKNVTDDATNDAVTLEENTIKLEEDVANAELSDEDKDKIDVACQTLRATIAIIKADIQKVDEDTKAANLKNITKEIVEGILSDIGQFENDMATAEETLIEFNNTLSTIDFTRAEQREPLFIDAQILLNDFQKLNTSIANLKDIIINLKISVETVNGGANGGYIFTRYNLAKKPYEFLIMDTDDVATSLKIWKWDSKGLSYGKNGIDGVFSPALDMEGKTLTGLEISTSAGTEPDAHIEVRKEYIDFKNSAGESIFSIGTNMPGAEAGKPQLFFSNGCSMDTFEGSFRLRTSATNYLRLNKEGGIDYVCTDTADGDPTNKTVVIVDKDGYLVGAKSNTVINNTANGFDIVGGNGTTNYTVTKNAEGKITEIYDGSHSININY